MFYCVREATLLQQNVKTLDVYNDFRSCTALASLLCWLAGALAGALLLKINYAAGERRGNETKPS